MVEEWFLLITLFVLQSDGNIDERRFNSVKQESEISCRLEANARIELFAPQIGQTILKKYTTGYRSCGYGGCREPDYDKDDGTYEIGLSGTLVGVHVGCKMEPKVLGQ